MHRIRATPATRVLVWRLVEWSGRWGMLDVLLVASADIFSSSYSGGMQRRLSIALALLGAAGYDGTGGLLPPPGWTAGGRDAACATPIPLPDGEPQVACAT